MIRFIPALLLVVVPFTLSAEDKKEEKKPIVFASKEGKFSVTLPDKPTEKTKKTATGVEIRLFTVDLEDRAYIVSYNDYKAGSVDPDTDKVLATVIKGNADSLKGKVVAEEKITIGKKKFPGREIRIEYGGEKKNVYRAKVFLVGDRFYQVVALGSDAFTKSMPVEDYLKSFAIDE